MSVKKMIHRTKQVVDVRQRATSGSRETTIFLILLIGLVWFLNTANFAAFWRVLTSRPAQSPSAVTKSLK